jgi:hypothetical protein
MVVLLRIPTEARNEFDAELTEELELTGRLTILPVSEHVIRVVIDRLGNKPNAAISEYEIRSARMCAFKAACTPVIRVGRTVYTGA